MPESATIGANFSSYQGNSNLGGGSLGVGKIDVNPVLDLARYTFLYNQTEAKQRQADAEKAAAELASMTDYDISTGIPKDAQILQDKYQKLLDYVKKNPDAINYRNKDQYLEFNRLKNDLQMDIAGAKQRNLLFKARMEKIAQNPDKKIAAIDESELQDEIQRTGIRQPLSFEKKYNIELPDVKEAPVISFDAYKAGVNEDHLRAYSILNVKKAREQGLALSEGLTLSSNLTNDELIRKTLTRQNNFFTKGTDQLNSVLSQKEYVDANGRVVKIKDDNGNVIKENLPTIAKNMVSLIDEVNDYLTKTKSDISSGVYQDSFKKPITFGNGVLDEKDYQLINYKDGISPEELGFIMVYQAHKGDTYKTTTVQTNTGIEQQRIGVQYANIAEERRHNKEIESKSSGGGAGKQEGVVKMDLSGLFGDPDVKSRLSRDDLEAIDDSFVVNDFGQYRVSQKGKDAIIEVINNKGDVKVYANAKDKKKGKGVVVPAETYNKNAISISQRGLKERAGQSNQLPFSNYPTSDKQLTEAEYFMKYGKAKPK